MKLTVILFAALQVLIGGRAEFNETTHDFGKITVADGPQNCVFTVTNKGKEPLTIYSAIPSCGCTGVNWTRESIEPGGSGKISVTYNNEDGPYPFDKTVIVYLSDMKKPVILHLRGEVAKK